MRADEPEFTEEFLNDPARSIAQGKELFAAECAQCHGSELLSGQGAEAEAQEADAPRTSICASTYGWRNMPAWEDVFSQDERMAITAYVKSKNFSN